MSGSSISKKMIQFNKIITHTHTHTCLAFSSQRRADLVLPFAAIVLIAKSVIKKKKPR